MTLTTNKGIDIIALGSPNWGTPINDNSEIIDKALGSFVIVTGTNGSITLTRDQYQNMCLKTGTAAFTGTVTFVIPSSVAGQWVIVNQSADSVYNLIVKNAASSTSVAIQNGATRAVYSDGTRVTFVENQPSETVQSLAVGAGRATTNASCVGTIATVTFNEAITIGVGQVISIKGVTPDGYNGVWTVTASSDGSVSFVVPATLGNETVNGVLYYGAITGSTLNLSNRGALSGRASQVEAETGTDNQTIMTPLRTAQAVEAQVVIATQAEAEAGTNNLKFMTPLRTAQAIDAQVVIATQAEAEAGTNNLNFMTPLRTSQAFENFLTTAQVLAETAGGTLNAVGTYAYLGDTSGGLTRGDTRLGSSLLYAVIYDQGGSDFFGLTLSGVPTGTWRLMSGSWTGSEDRWTGLFLRIS